MQTLIDQLQMENQAFSLENLDLKTRFEEGLEYEQKRNDTLDRWCQEVSKGLEEEAAKVMAYEAKPYE